MTGLLDIPPEATLETTFRCEHWRCTLAFRHCLRRQAESKHRGPGAKDRTPIPLHPYCATECDDGRIVAVRFGVLSIAPLGRSALGALQRPAPKAGAGG